MSDHVMTFACSIILDFGLCFGTVNKAFLHKDPEQLSESSVLQNYREVVLLNHNGCYEFRSKPNIRGLKPFW